MSKERLNKEELELLGTESGAYAVVLGYLKSVDNKITPSKFNKLIKELGYERVRPADLANFAHSMQEENGVLYSLYTKSFRREIKLDDLPDAIGEDKGLPEDNVFDILSSQILMKERANLDMREFRKLQKDGTLMKLMMDDMNKYLVKELQGLPRVKFLKTPVDKPKKGDRNLIIAISDTHIGFVSHGMQTGSYNFDVLTTSINDIINFAIELINERDIKRVYLFHLGDMEENNILRSSQNYDLEYPLAQQVAVGIRLVIDMLTKLSKVAHVTFAAVAGNHSRFDQNKKDTVFNNNSTYVLVETLITLQESLGQLANVDIVDNRADTYKFDIEVAGKRIVGVHGDHMPKGAEKIPPYMKDGKEIFILFSGHLHSTFIKQESFHRLHIQVGSTIGENHYSRLGNYPTTGPSQMIVILREGMVTPEIIPLMLDNEGRLC